MLIVASESNGVSAIDAATGKTLWSRDLGRPEPRSAFPCGNIDPVASPARRSSTGATQTLYLDAMVPIVAPPQHEFYAGAQDGSILPGWPVDVADALRAQGRQFDDPSQDERGALA